MIFGRLIGKVLFRTMLGSTALVGATMNDTPIEQTRFIDLSDYLPNTLEDGERFKDISKVKGEVLHHTASKGQSFKSIAEFLVFAKKWGVISYDKGVNWEGIIYILKKPDILGYHTSGYNRIAFSIVLLGNFSEVYPTYAMKQGLDKAIKYDFETYNLQWCMMHVTAKRFYNGAVTECPGLLTYGWLSGYEFDERIDDVRRYAGLPYEPKNHFNESE